MKKFISALLSLIMTLSLSVPTFAKSETEASADRIDSLGVVIHYNAKTEEILYENGEPFAFEDVEFSMPVASTSDSDDLFAQADLELYLVRGGLKKPVKGNLHGGIMWTALRLLSKSRILN